MDQEYYRKIIEHIIDGKPDLKELLRQKCVQAYGKDGTLKKSITICNEGDPRFHELKRLFPPDAFIRQGGKYKLFSNKIEDAEAWFSAVKQLFPVEKKNDRQAENIAFLDLRFPELSNSCDCLRGVKKSYSRDFLTDAFKTVEFLLHNDTVQSPSELGAKLFNDSKVFRKGTPLRNLSVQLLAAELCMDAYDNEILTKCGIVENPTAITVCVYGPFVCEYKDGSRLDWIKQLWKLGEAATLNMTNLENLTKIELDIATTPFAVTCENESPFNRIIRDKEPFSAIYTAGQPNSAVKKFLRLMEPDIPVRHWGDTDPTGLDIAATLYAIRPLKLFRCSLTDSQRLLKHLKPLNSEQIVRGNNLRANSDFIYQEELAFTMQNGWLEQESWLPTDHE